MNIILKTPHHTKETAQELLLKGMYAFCTIRSWSIDWSVNDI
jgi:hypothetical protein